MVRKLLFILFVCISAVAKADYHNISLSEVLCKVDYGAVGTIVKTDNNYFYLKVEKYVLNKLELDTLPIIKFGDWACAKRYDAYKIGQRELVFFKKSNDVIPVYDFFLYGMGDESELPIYKDSISYQVGFDKLQAYGLNDFLGALSDFAKLKESARKTSREITASQWEAFAKRSAMHRRFVGRCYDEDESIFNRPKEGFVVSLQADCLYENYENKVFIDKSIQDRIVFSIKDADVRRKKNYFLVKPGKGSARRMLAVYAIKQGKRNSLFEYLVDVRQLPVPDLHFHTSVKDTIEINYGKEAIPAAAHFTGNMQEDEFLEYKLLAYNYEITSGDRHYTFSAKNAYGTNDFRERLTRLETNDKITISNVFVLYPNKEVKRLADRTVIVKMMKKKTVYEYE